MRKLFRVVAFLWMVAGAVRTISSKAAEDAFGLN